jgi:steroid delta-isomerase-like uncharacterized protein
MSLQENKDIVRRVVESLNEGKLAGLEELYTGNFVNHDPSARAVRDRSALLQRFDAERAGFPDGHITIEDLVAEGDKVVERWTFRGTHNGEFMGIPATGKEIAMTGIGIYRISGGKVAECWWNSDTLGAMQQLGLIPPLGE